MLDLALALLEHSERDALQVRWQHAVDVLELLESRGEIQFFRLLRHCRHGEQSDEHTCHAQLQHVCSSRFVPRAVVRGHTFSITKEMQLKSGARILSQLDFFGNRVRIAVAAIGLSHQTHGFLIAVDFLGIGLEMNRASEPVRNVCQVNQRAGDMALFDGRV